MGAGLVHAAAAGTHTGDTTLVWLFATTAVVQGTAGAAILANPSRRNLLCAGGVQIAAVGAWAMSRTVGLPLIDSLAGREPVGGQDLAAALLAAGAVVTALVALHPAPNGSRPRRILWAPALAVLPALAGVVAPHTHDASHDHEHGHEEQSASSTGATTDGHDHSTGAAASAGDARPGGGGVLVGLDTSGASEDDVAAATDLVERARDALDPAITDTAAAEAAGYVWIGDGRRPGRFQHYVNPALLTDGRILDPDHIEALVFENTADGPVLRTAMYVLEPGATMADVPDVGGDLLVWHEHQNLCWDESGTRLAGVSTDGTTCHPAGVLRATPPMLHVWLDDHECGPFAGVEGHGATECSGHQH